MKQGQETVSRGQEVVRESQKVSAVVRMNIVKDPVYGANPELAAVFSESAREQDKRLEDQQHKLEADALRSRSDRSTWRASKTRCSWCSSLSSRSWSSRSGSLAFSSPTASRGRSTK